MKNKLLLAAVLLVGLGLRLYKIDNPIADWHSWRQADTAAVARNFLKFGFDPLRPRYDDLSNVASGKDNPSGWRMVEFPLYQLIGAALFKLTGILSVEIWLRLVSIFAALGSAYLLYRFGKELVGESYGLLTAGLFLTLPYSVYYSRVILPEPLGVFCALAALYFALRQRWFITAVFVAVALLVKPTVGFILLPLIYFGWKQYGANKLLQSPLTYLFSLFCLAPLLLWRYWILKFPAGIPAYGWLLNGDGIRFKGAWFYWIFGERIAKLILGFWGIFFLAIGILVGKTQKYAWFVVLLGVGALLYLAVFATGNVKHDYYQIVILPATVMLVALGIDFILSHGQLFINKYIVFIFTAFCLAMMFALSWHEVRTYYWINHPAIVTAGRAADQLLPQTAKVIAPYSGDTAFLYQTNRQGWPIGFAIEAKIKKGAGYYVSIHPDGAIETMLKNKYTVLRETKDYIIIRLR